MVLLPQLGKTQRVLLRVFNAVKDQRAISSNGEKRFDAFAMAVIYPPHPYSNLFYTLFPFWVHLFVLYFRFLVRIFNATFIVPRIFTQVI